MQNKKVSIFHAVVIMVLAGIAGVSFKAAAQYDGLLKIWMLDVGQGDAILIQSPVGTQVLVDGGPGDAVLGEISKILPLTDRSIDAVVVSHPHADHIGGLPAVLEQYDVSIVLEAHEQYDSSLFRTWRQAVEAEHAQQIEALPGVILDLGGGATLTVLHPLKSSEGIVTKTPHEYNVSLLLRYGAMAMIFTGDMEIDAERELTTTGVRLDADVLKIGHHGSKTSTSSEFLNAVTPQIALISVGDNNRYGHPDPSTLARLEEFGVPYYRTDVQGMITITGDGARFVVRTEK